MSVRPASFFIFALTLLLSACSLYQSEGRKYLEKNSITFSSSAASQAEWNFEAKQVAEPCAELYQAPVLSKSEWSVAEETNVGQTLFQSEIEDEFSVLMYVRQDQRHFLCAFSYTDITHRIQQMNSDLNIGYQSIQHLLSF